jgi:hypothetical protein
MKDPPGKLTESQKINTNTDAIMNKMNLVPHGKTRFVTRFLTLIGLGSTLALSSPAWAGTVFVADTRTGAFAFASGYRPARVLREAAVNRLAWYGGYPYFVASDARRGHMALCRKPYRIGARTYYLFATGYHPTSAINANIDAGKHIGGGQVVANIDDKNAVPPMIWNQR